MDIVDKNGADDAMVEESKGDTAVPCTVILNRTTWSRNRMTRCMLLCVRLLVIFSSFLDHISSYEHLLPKTLSMSSQEGRPYSVVEV